MIMNLLQIPSYDKELSYLFGILGQKFYFTLAVFDAPQTHLCSQSNPQQTFPNVGSRAPVPNSNLALQRQR